MKYVGISTKWIIFFIFFPLGEGSLYAAHPMAWGTYMLRSSFVSVFIRLRVTARHHEALP
jgi:hypothetical protein